MLRSAVNILKVLATTLLIVLAGYCLLEGIRILESGGPHFGRAYTLIGGAAAVLILLPSSCSLLMIGNHKGLLCLLCLAGSAILQYLTLRRLDTGSGYGTAYLIPYWLGSLALMAVAGHVFDKRRLADDAPRVFQRGDWLLAAALFALSFFLRITSPMSMAVDEGIHFTEMQGFIGDPGITPWGVTVTGYPLMLHRIVFEITSFLSPLIGSFIVTKALVAGMGGVSVGALFLVVRVFAPRLVALSAGTLLILFGWHWLNSRFGYLYPYDLAFVSISALASIVALHYHRAGAAVIAGIVMGFALLMQKFGVFLIPFTALLCLDYLCTSERKDRKRIIILGAIIFTSALLCYLPFLVANGGPLESPRFNVAKSTRAGLLRNLGMTETQAFFEMWRDAFRQLQIQMNDIPRHMFRGHKPLLDPIFSGLFSIGLCAALVHSFRQRAARIQILGLLVFIAPMVVSFPLDSPGAQGMARRLLGISFFSAWIAASGAAVLSSRLVAARHIGKVCLTLALASLACNWYYLKTKYETMPAETWYFDYGGKRAALMTMTQSFVIKGLSVIVLDEPASSIASITPLMRTIMVADSIDTLRQKILTPTGTWKVVIVSWPELMSASSTMPTQLGDLVSPNAWLTGPVDNHGVPMFAYSILANG